MYQNINYAKTRQAWKKTHKKLSPVAKEYGVNPATARSFLHDRLRPQDPDAGVHAKIAKMFEAEGCLVFRKIRRSAAENK